MECVQENGKKGLSSDGTCPAGKSHERGRAPRKVVKEIVRKKEFSKSDHR